jgi:predicted secreted Zn-dependent protease
MPVTISGPQWTTFDVHGPTLTEIGQHLEAMPEAAQTGWHGGYHVTRWTGNTIAAVQVDVNISVSMPHWVENSAAPAAQQAEWERFLTALRAHEQGHVDLITTYLQHADTILENVSEETAAQNWNDNNAALQAASDQYDTSTDHGRNAGTTINLPSE